ncbi:uncharacterized protein LOC127877284 isoform X2 [Dreissena polymorpha]|uniref:uncharacterized protein LOC127877284 isoform X2 n=1 Tax=Dreissena polymorpha TaxID=45954 RepID=UPI002264C84D|nr:uncharacterized protein LOC127877284 isoform X2 [Dreissena polymorpha]
MDSSIVGSSVWKGKIFVKQSYACKAEIRTRAQGYLLSERKIHLNVHWKLDLQQTEKRYLAGIESLDTTSESCQNSWFYNVGKLVPLINHGASSSGHDVVNFKKLVAYLSAKQTVAVITPQKEEILLLMNGNHVTSRLGLLESSSPFLHCILMSRESKNRNRDTLNALDNICLSELFMEPSTNQWEASEPRRSLLTNGTVHEAFQQQYLEKCRRASGLALQSLEINSQTPDGKQFRKDKRHNSIERGHKRTTKRHKSGDTLDLSSTTNHNSRPTGKVAYKHSQSIDSNLGKLSNSSNQRNEGPTDSWLKIDFGGGQQFGIPSETSDGSELGPFIVLDSLNEEVRRSESDSVSHSFKHKERRNDCSKDKHNKKVTSDKKKKRDRTKESRHREKGASNDTNKVRESSKDRTKEMRQTEKDASYNTNNVKESSNDRTKERDHAKNWPKDKGNSSHQINDKERISSKDRDKVKESCALKDQQNCNTVANDGYKIAKNELSNVNGSMQKDGEKDDGPVSHHLKNGNKDKNFSKDRHRERDISKERYKGNEREAFQGKLNVNQNEYSRNLIKGNTRENHSKDGRKGSKRDHSKDTHIVKERDSSKGRHQINGKDNLQHEQSVNHRSCSKDGHKLEKKRDVSSDWHRANQLNDLIQQRDERNKNNNKDNNKEQAEMMGQDTEKERKSKRVASGDSVNSKKSNQHGDRDRPSRIQSPSDVFSSIFSEVGCENIRNVGKIPKKGSKRNDASNQTNASKKTRYAHGGYTRDHSKSGHKKETNVVEPRSKKKKHSSGSPDKNFLTPSDCMEDDVTNYSSEEHLPSDPVLFAERLDDHETVYPSTSESLTSIFSSVLSVKKSSRIPGICDERSNDSSYNKTSTESVNVLCHNKPVDIQISERKVLITDGGLSVAVSHNSTICKTSEYVCNVLEAVLYGLDLNCDLKKNEYDLYKVCLTLHDSASIDLERCVRQDKERLIITRKVANQNVKPELVDNFQFEAPTSESVADSDVRLVLSSTTEVSGEGNIKNEKYAKRPESIEKIEDLRLKAGHEELAVANCKGEAESKLKKCRHNANMLEKATDLEVLRSEAMHEDSSVWRQMCEAKDQLTRNDTKLPEINKRIEALRQNAMYEEPAVTEQKGGSDNELQRNVAKLLESNTQLEALSPDAVHEESAVTKQNSEATDGPRKHVTKLPESNKTLVALNREATYENLQQNVLDKHIEHCDGRKVKSDVVLALPPPTNYLSDDESQDVHWESRELLKDRHESGEVIEIGNELVEFTTQSVKLADVEKAAGLRGKSIIRENYSKDIHTVAELGIRASKNSNGLLPFNTEYQEINLPETKIKMSEETDILKEIQKKSVKMIDEKGDRFETDKRVARVDGNLNTCNAAEESKGVIGSNLVTITFNADQLLNKCTSTLQSSEGEKVGHMVRGDLSPQKNRAILSLEKNIGKGIQNAKNKQLSPIKSFDISEKVITRERRSSASIVGRNFLKEINIQLASAITEPKQVSLHTDRSSRPEKRQERQFHPYKKTSTRQTERIDKPSWSFDLAYRDMNVLLQNLTENTFKKEKRKPTVYGTRKQGYGTNRRFYGYHFQRSEILRSPPSDKHCSSDEEEPVVPAAIPDLLERQQKADILEEFLLVDKVNEQDNYVYETDPYQKDMTEETSEWLKRSSQEAIDKAKLMLKSSSLSPIPTKSVTTGKCPHSTRPSDESLKPGGKTSATTKPSRSPTPVRRTKSSRSPTPVGRTKSSRSPTPVRRTKSSRSPTPVGRTKSSRSPTPVSRTKSSRSPTPVSRTKSSRSTTPVTISVTISPLTSRKTSTEPSKSPTSARKTSKQSSRSRTQAKKPSSKYSRSPTPGIKTSRSPTPIRKTSTRLSRSPTHSRKPPRLSKSPTICPSSPSSARKTPVTQNLTLMSGSPLHSMQMCETPVSTQPSSNKPEHSNNALLVADNSCLPNRTIQQEKGLKDYFTVGNDYMINVDSGKTKQLSKASETVAKSDTQFFVETKQCESLKMEGRIELHSTMPSREIDEQKSKNAITKKFGNDGFEHEDESELNLSSDFLVLDDIGQERDEEINIQTMNPETIEEKDVCQIMDANEHTLKNTELHKGDCDGFAINDASSNLEEPEKEMIIRKVMDKDCLPESDYADLIEKLHEGELSIENPSDILLSENDIELVENTDENNNSSLIELDSELDEEEIKDIFLETSNIENHESLKVPMLVESEAVQCGQSKKKQKIDDANEGLNNYEKHEENKSKQWVEMINSYSDSEKMQKKEVSDCLLQDTDINIFEEAEPAFSSENNDSILLVEVKKQGDSMATDSAIVNANISDVMPNETDSKARFEQKFDQTVGNFEPNHACKQQEKSIAVPSSTSAEAMSSEDKHVQKRVYADDYLFEGSNISVIEDCAKLIGPNNYLEKETYILNMCKFMKVTKDCKVSNNVQQLSENKADLKNGIKEDTTVGVEKSYLNAENYALQCISENLDTKYDCSMHTHLSSNPTYEQVCETSFQLKYSNLEKELKQEVNFVMQTNCQQFESEIVDLKKKDTDIGTGNRTMDFDDLGQQNTEESSLTDKESGFCDNIESEPTNVVIGKNMYLGTKCSVSFESSKKEDLKPSLCDSEPQKTNGTVESSRIEISGLKQIGISYCSSSDSSRENSCSTWKTSHCEPGDMTTSEAVIDTVKSVVNEVCRKLKKLQESNFSGYEMTPDTIAMFEQDVSRSSRSENTQKPLVFPDENTEAAREYPLNDDANLKFNDIVMQNGDDRENDDCDSSSNVVIADYSQHSEDDSSSGFKYVFLNAFEDKKRQPLIEEFLIDIEQSSLHHQELEAEVSDKLQDSLDFDLRDNNSEVLKSFEEKLKKLTAKSAAELTVSQPCQIADKHGLEELILEQIYTETLSETKVLFKAIAAKTDELGSVETHTFKVESIDQVTLQVAETVNAMVNTINKTFEQFGTDFKEVKLSDQGDIATEHLVASMHHEIISEANSDLSALAFSEAKTPLERYAVEVINPENTLEQSMSVQEETVHKKISCKTKKAKACDQVISETKSDPAVADLSKLLNDLEERKKQLILEEFLKDIERTSARHQAMESEVFNKHVGLDEVIKEGSGFVSMMKKLCADDNPSSSIAMGAKACLQRMVDSDSKQASNIKVLTEEDPTQLLTSELGILPDAYCSQIPPLNHSQNQSPINFLSSQRKSILTAYTGATIVQSGQMSISTKGYKEKSTPETENQLKSTMAADTEVKPPSTADPKVKFILADNPIVKSISRADPYVQSPIATYNGVKSTITADHEVHEVESTQAAYSNVKSTSIVDSKVQSTITANTELKTLPASNPQLVSTSPADFEMKFTSTTDSKVQSTETASPSQKSILTAVTEVESTCMSESGSSLMAEPEEESTTTTDLEWKSLSIMDAELNFTSEAQTEINSVTIKASNFEKKSTSKTYSSENLESAVDTDANGTLLTNAVENQTYVGISELNQNESKHAICTKVNQLAMQLESGLSPIKTLTVRKRKKPASKTQKMFVVLDPGLDSIDDVDTVSGMCNDHDDPITSVIAVNVVSDAISAEVCQSDINGKAKLTSSYSVDMQSSLSRLQYEENQMVDRDACSSENQSSSSYSSGIDPVQPPSCNEPQNIFESIETQSATLNPYMDYALVFQGNAHSSMYTQSPFYQHYPYGWPSSSALFQSPLASHWHTSSGSESREYLSPSYRMPYSSMSNPPQNTYNGQSMYSPQFLNRVLNPNQNAAAYSPNNLMFPYPDWIFSPDYMAMFSPGQNPYFYYVSEGNAMSETHLCMENMNTYLKTSDWELIDSIEGHCDMIPEDEKTESEKENSKCLTNVSEMKNPNGLGKSVHKFEELTKLDLPNTEIESSAHKGTPQNREALEHGPTVTFTAESTSVRVVVDKASHNGVSRTETVVKSSRTDEILQQSFKTDNPTRKPPAINSVDKIPKGDKQEQNAWNPRMLKDICMAFILKVKFAREFQCAMPAKAKLETKNKYVEKISNQIDVSTSKEDSVDEQPSKEKNHSRELILLDENTESKTKLQNLKLDFNVRNTNNEHAPWSIGKMLQSASAQEQRKKILLFDINSIFKNKHNAVDKHFENIDYINTENKIEDVRTQSDELEDIPSLVKPDSPLSGHEWISCMQASVLHCKHYKEKEKIIAVEILPNVNSITYFDHSSVDFEAQQSETNNCTKTDTEIDISNSSAEINSENKENQYGNKTRPSEDKRIPDHPKAFQLLLNSYDSSDGNEHDNQKATRKLIYTEQHTNVSLHSEIIQEFKESRWLKEDEEQEIDLTGEIIKSGLETFSKDSKFTTSARIRDHIQGTKQDCYTVKPRTYVDKDCRDDNSTPTPKSKSVDQNKNPDATDLAKEVFNNETEIMNVVDKVYEHPSFKTKTKKDATPNLQLVKKAKSECLSQKNIALPDVCPVKTTKSKRKMDFTNIWLKKNFDEHYQTAANPVKNKDNDAKTTKKLRSFPIIDFKSIHVFETDDLEPELNKSSQLDTKKSSRQESLPEKYFTPKNIEHIEKIQSSKVKKLPNCGKLNENVYSGPHIGAGTRKNSLHLSSKKSSLKHSSKRNSKLRSSTSFDSSSSSLLSSLSHSTENSRKISKTPKNGSKGRRQSSFGSTNSFLSSSTASYSSSMKAGKKSKKKSKLRSRSSSSTSSYSSSSSSLSSTTLSSSISSSTTTGKDTKTPRNNSKGKRRQSPFGSSSSFSSSSTAIQSAKKSKSKRPKNVEHVRGRSLKRKLDRSSSCSSVNSLMRKSLSSPVHNPERRGLTRESRFVKNTCHWNKSSRYKRFQEIRERRPGRSKSSSGPHCTSQSESDANTQRKRHKSDKDFPTSNNSFDLKSHGFSRNASRLQYLKDESFVKEGGKRLYRSDSDSSMMTDSSFHSWRKKHGIKMARMDRSPSSTDNGCSRNRRHSCGRSTKNYRKTPDRFCFRNSIGYSNVVMSSPDNTSCHTGFVHRKNMKSVFISTLTLETMSTDSLENLLRGLLMFSDPNNTWRLHIICRQVNHLKKLQLKGKLELLCCERFSQVVYLGQDNMNRTLEEGMKEKYRSNGIPVIMIQATKPLLLTPGIVHRTLEQFMAWDLKSVFNSCTAT